MRERLLFARPMVRLIWFVEPERLPQAMSQLQQFGCFQPVVRHRLGTRYDASSWQRAYDHRQSLLRRQQMQQLLDRLPATPLLNYAAGEAHLPLPSSDGGAIWQVHGGAFLWVGQQTPTEVLRRHLYRETLEDNAFLPETATAEQCEAIAQSCDALGQVDSLLIIDGWIPADAHARVAQALAGERLLWIAAERSGLPEEEVPTHHPVPVWLSGFERLTRLYAIPGYREVQPTMLVVPAFVLMFGLMFADLGQGALLALLALFLLRRSEQRQLVRDVGGVLLPVGLSAALFGALFGVCLAHEDWIAPLWLHPIEGLTLYLLATLGIGVAMLCTGMLLSLINLWRQGALPRELWSVSGLTGLLFYLALLLTAWAYYFEVVWLARLTAAVALLLLLQVAIGAYRHAQGFGMVMRSFVALIEAYDFVAKYPIHTLSFVRIAAFSVAHIALSTALMIVVDVVEPWPLLAWVLFVAGNLFIIVVEGVLVSIQVTRLHFFEFFSKFVGGRGIEFQPLHAASGSREVS